MLAVCSLRDLLTMSSQELFSTIPWVPAKVLKVIITLMIVRKFLNNFLDVLGVNEVNKYNRHPRGGY